MGDDATPVGKTVPMVDKGRGVIRRWRSEIIVSLTAIWSARAFWMPGGVVTSYDGAMYSMPNTEVTRTALQSGRIPFLNDLIFGGVPHLGNHAVGVLYPPRWLTLVIDTAPAHGLIVAAHLVALGLGMVVLARHLGIGEIGTSSAGLVAVLAGSTLTKTIQYEQIQPVAWMPWLILAIVLVGRRGDSRRPIGVLAGVTALTVLSGHPQLIVEVGVVAAAVAVGALLARRISLGRLCAGVGVGMMATGVQIAATLAARGSASLEQGRSFDELSNGAYILQVRAVGRAVFGTVLNRDPASFSGAFEAIVWIGVSGAALAVLGALVSLAEPEQRSWSIPVVLMAVLGLIWSLGPRTPVFTVAYEVIPGFDLGRVSARWLVIVGLLCALLIGAGIDAVRHRLHGRVLFGLSGFGVVVVLAVIGPLRPDEVSVVTIWLFTGTLVLAGLLMRPRSLRAGVLAGVVAVELVLLSLQALPGRVVLDEAVGTTSSPAVAELVELANDGGLTVALTPDSGPHDQLVQGLRPNANVWFGLRSIDGYDGGVQVTEMWATALQRFTPEPALDMPLRSSLSAPVSPDEMARLGVRWMVVARDREPIEWVPDWIGPVAEDSLVTIWENPAWIGEAVAWFDSRDPVGAPADVLRTADGSLRETLLVRGEAVECDTNCTPVPVDLERITPEHLRVSASVDRTAIVTVPVQALPGWQVAIDGESASTVVADGLFLGVTVDPGAHIIEFRYRPRWWWPSVVLSAAGLVAMGALIVERRRFTS